MSDVPYATPRITPLDGVDRHILDLLALNARMPNSAIAEAVGIAPSTCLGRIRHLVETGVIKGFTIDVDPSALGRPLQAMISVRIQAGAREQIPAFMERMKALPEVLAVYFLGGTNDFMVHIAARDSDDLRHFVVEHLSIHPEVGATETSVIFDHIRPHH
ncbi:Lrp/AsnC family transcriptional regulator [Micrococcales bacterium 31B]|nr:Lrp/AsnC family transcriptional regulator [Micrococcales bacterium 31B]